MYYISISIEYSGQKFSCKRKNDVYKILRIDFLSKLKYDTVYLYDDFLYKILSKNDHAIDFVFFEEACQSAVCRYFTSIFI